MFKIEEHGHIAHRTWLSSYSSTTGNLFSGSVLFKPGSTEKELRIINLFSAAHTMCVLLNMYVNFNMFNFQNLIASLQKYQFWIINLIF